MHALVNDDAVSYSSEPEATMIVEDRSIAESDDVTNGQLQFCYHGYLETLSFVFSTGRLDA